MINNLRRVKSQKSEDLEDYNSSCYTECRWSANCNHKKNRRRHAYDLYQYDRNHYQHFHHHYCQSWQFCLLASVWNTERKTRLNLFQNRGRRMFARKEHIPTELSRIHNKINYQNPSIQLTCMWKKINIRNSKNSGKIWKLISLDKRISTWHNIPAREARYVWGAIVQPF
jgi:hypothetical protein